MNIWTCASAEFADVDFYCGPSAFANGVRNGDLVYVPEDDATWTEMIHCSLAIGIILDSNTIIRNAVTDGRLFTWDYVSGGYHRLSGGTFVDAGAGEKQGIFAFNGTNTNGTKFRINGCTFDELNGEPFEFNNVVGLVDHNIINTPNKIIARINNGNWNDYGSVGDESWSDATEWGSEEILVFEDNVSTNVGVTVTGAFFDGARGLRAVARFNTLTRGQYTMHGTESYGRNRGGRKMEVYCNDITGNDDGSFQSFVDARSGVSMVHNNKLRKYTSGKINLTADRTYFPFEPWLGADGTNKFDDNESGTFGASPFTATSGGTLTVTVSGAGWDASNGGQWKGYSVRKLTGSLGASNRFSIINSNTADTLTLHDDGSFGGNITFTSGDTFEIRKVKHSLDQPGRSGGTRLFHQDTTSLVRGGTGNLVETLTSPVAMSTLGIGNGDYIMTFNAYTNEDNSCFGIFGPVYNVSGNTLQYDVASDPGANYTNQVYFSRIPVPNNQTSEGCREWLNRQQDGSQNYLHHGADTPNITKNIHFWDYDPSYNGSSAGTGSGTKTQMLAISPNVGDGYWVTDEGDWNQGNNSIYSGQGVLYICEEAGVWPDDPAYEPSVYPHPLVNNDPYDVAPETPTLQGRSMQFFF